MELSDFWDEKRCEKIHVEKADLEHAENTNFLESDTEQPGEADCKTNTKPSFKKAFVCNLKKYRVFYAVLTWYSSMYLMLNVIYALFCSEERQRTEMWKSLMLHLEEDGTKNEVIEAFHGFWRMHLFSATWKLGVVALTTLISLCILGLCIVRRQFSNRDLTIGERFLLAMMGLLSIFFSGSAVFIQAENYQLIQKDISNLISKGLW